MPGRWKSENPLLTRVVAFSLVATARALFRTCRVVTLPEGAVWRIAYEQHEPRELFLYCIWHDLLLFPIFARPARNMSTLVSSHRDGSYLAEGMKRLGIGAVRGSTTRGGTRAVRELMRTAERTHISITPDGPRGPRRRMKSGIVYLASRTGRAIIPTGYSASRYWSVQGRWTDLRVPRPLSTVYLLGGEPIRVPPNLSRAGIEHFTAVVQREMDHLTELAECHARGECIEDSRGFRAAA